MKPILFFLFIISTTCLGQQNKRQQHFNMLLGYNHSLIKDLNFSPLKYTSHSPVLAFKFGNETSNRLIHANLDFNISKITTSAANYLTANRYFFNIEFGYLKHLSVIKEKLRFSFGGQFHSYSDIIIFNDLLSVSYFANHSIDFVGEVCYQINTKHSIRSKLSLPVIGILSRPPYSGWDNYVYNTSAIGLLIKGEPSSYGRFMAIGSTTEYLLKLNEKWNLLAQYRIRYNTTNHLKIGFEL